jgi:hypothetical protein
LTPSIVLRDQSKGVHTAGAGGGSLRSDGVAAQFQSVLRSHLLITY